MHMTEAEICREYRQAKNQKAQIDILAELNGCGRDEIIAMLARNGESGPGMNPACVRKKENPGRLSKRWDTARARVLYGEGQTDQEIADAVGVSSMTICTWRKEEGLPSNRKRRGPERKNAPESPQMPGPVGRTEPTPAVPLDDSSPVPAVKGPVELSVELDGRAFILRAPSLEEAVWIHAQAGRVLEGLMKEPGRL